MTVASCKFPISVHSMDIYIGGSVAFYTFSQIQIMLTISHRVDNDIIVTNNAHAKAIFTTYICNSQCP